MCILYIMITVYNNISVKYLKSKNKQDATYVHINRLSFILFLCLHRRSSPIIFCCCCCCCFFLRHRSTTTEAALEKKTDDRVTNRVQILQPFFFLWHLNVERILST